MSPIQRERSFCEQLMSGNFCEKTVDTAAKRITMIVIGLFLMVNATTVLLVHSPLVGAAKISVIIASCAGIIPIGFVACRDYEQCILDNSPKRPEFEEKLRELEAAAAQQAIRRY